VNAYGEKVFSQKKTGMFCKTCEDCRTVLNDDREKHRSGKRTSYIDEICVIVESLKRKKIGDFNVVKLIAKQKRKKAVQYFTLL
jgi:hypothetical protein